MESGSVPAKKVMVVAEPTRESAGALQYAISHVIVENDELILLHIENPNFSWRNTFSFLSRKSSFASMSWRANMEAEEVDFIQAMIQVCEVAQPKVSIRTERIQMGAGEKDKDKAKAILNRSQMLGVDVLILGQRRSLSGALLGRYKRSGGLKSFDIADYLIEKSKCTCVGVHKRGQNAGYLLNTKTHKDFWLLA